MYEAVISVMYTRFFLVKYNTKIHSYQIIIHKKLKFTSLSWTEGSNLDMINQSKGIDEGPFSCDNFPKNNHNQLSLSI